VVAAALVPGATSASQPAHFNGRIAFPVLNTVILMNPDGSGMWPTRATGIGWVDGWSPDGTKLLVEAENDLFAVDPEGGNRTRLTSSSAYDGQAAYSPDGSRIAFMSTRDGQARVWVMNADGSDPHTITSNFPGSARPTWSPDGSQIAFTTGYSSVWITSGNDRIIGGEGRDAINGDDGNDTIVAGPGSDLVNGGDGDDTIDSRDGDPDFVNGWQGTDTVLADRRIDGTSELEPTAVPRSG
jgi:dipeptidyl aminopeptidase/acylaminoacyl peptidase